MTLPPTSLDDKDVERLRVYSGAEWHPGPVLLLPDHTPIGLSTPEIYESYVETSTGVSLLVRTRDLAPATIVDAILFQEERADYLAARAALTAEHTQLDEENQDLAVGDEVLVLSRVLLDDLEQVVDGWTYEGIRPGPTTLKWLTDRLTLWETESHLHIVERPPRDVGGTFRLRSDPKAEASRHSWYSVRRKF